ncbi:MAG: hypothetical protein NUV81_04055 [bacterium]|nr:hypothetical protein [bacterium]
MTEREQAILRLVIEDVVATGEPVGSQYLVRKYDLNMSPATLRAVFVSLEEMGFLTHPHTSAGRVPTEKGYRVYLQELMRIRELRQREHQRLQNAAQSMYQLAYALSVMTQSAFVMMERRQMRPFSTGLSHLMSQPEFADQAKMQRLGTALDELDQTFDSIDARVQHEPIALIGQECPFGEDCGSVFMRVGDDLFVSLFGPLRMDYARAVSALKSAQQLFDEYER